MITDFENQNSYGTTTNFTRPPRQAARLSARRARGFANSSNKRSTRLTRPASFVVSPYEI
jgi:hypothetical protein